MLSRTPSTGSAAFRGLVIAFGISAIGFGTIEPFLVVWAHRDAGLAGSAAGLLFVAQAVGELCGGLAGGLIADRFGARQVLLVSTLGMAAGYGSMAAIEAPAPALIVIFLAGLFEAAYHPTAFAIVGDVKAPGDRASAYGLVRAAGSLGTILGPLAGAAVIAGAPVADVFLASGVLLAASGIVVLTTLPRRGLHVSLEEEAEEVQAAVPGIKAIGRDRALRRLVIGGALSTITLAWWEADGLAIIHTQRAFGTGAFSIMLALAAAATVIFQVPVSRLTRDRPVAALLAGGAVLQALGLALLLLASVGLGIVVAGVLLVAFGQMLAGPNLNALVSTIAPPGRGVSYQAALSTTADIGMAAGPASGLALSSGIGARATWALALPLGLVAGALTARAARDARAADRHPAQDHASEPIPLPEEEPV